MVDKQRNEDEGMYLYSNPNDAVNDLGCGYSNNEVNDVVFHGSVFNIYKPLVELSTKNIIGMIFEAFTDAWKFYKAYALAKWFGVRHGSTRHNNEGALVSQQFCCSRRMFRIKKLKLCNRKRRSRPI